MKGEVEIIISLRESNNLTPAVINALKLVKEVAIFTET
jgi:hypothetical protein